MLLFNYYFEKLELIQPLNVTSIYYLVFVFAASILLFFINKSIIKSFIIFCLSILFIWSFSQDFYFVIVSLLVCVYGYLASIVLDKTKNKILYIALSIIPIALLIYFKSSLLNTSLIVPLGISFYILRLIWYFNYIYNGKIELQKNPLAFSNYLIFFPSYIAGPIEKPNVFFDELNKNSSVDYKNIKKGWIRLLYGIFEKIVICDYIGEIVEMILPNGEITGFVVLVGIILYSFQIYLDFDSYSNIALGSASIIGIELNENFKSPYLAKNIKEFWNRWHISLSTWLKENVYLPLGGNRKGNLRKVINIIIVFIVSGLWHGFAIHFVLWGIAHAIIRIIEDIIEKVIGNNINNKLLILFRIIINFVIVSFTWLLFKYDNLLEITLILNRLKEVSAISLSSLLTNHELIWLITLIMFVIVIDVLKDKINIYELIARFYFPFRLAIYFIFIVIFLIFGVYGGSIEPADFIYRWF